MGMLGDVLIPFSGALDRGSLGLLPYLVVQSQYTLGRFPIKPSCLNLSCALYDTNEN